ncbi:tyrosine-type recombinase/integrase [Elusimicrobiota bacterium]
MGSLWLRNKKWYIDYYFNGKRIREPIGFSKTLAKQSLAKVEAEIAEGKFFPCRRKNTLTFGEMCELYWENYAKRKRNFANEASAHRAHLYVLKVSKAFGNRTLNMISTLDILEYLNKLQAKPCSPATVNRNLAIIKSVFNRAIEWDKFYGLNPTTKIKKMHEDNKRLRFLTKEEITRLLSVCPEKLSPVVITALMTGMRKQEILDLRWENIDLRQGVAYVLKSKSGRSREIPIASKLKQLLLFLNPKTEGFVFEISYKNVRDYFNTAVKMAGIRNFRFHDLRHTFASHFIMKTSDLPALQKILGHASPQMTQRYAHLARGHLADNMARFEEGMVTNWSQLGEKDTQNQLEISSKSVAK